jgi:hypothetical protein
MVPPRTGEPTEGAPGKDDDRVRQHPPPQTHPSQPAHGGTFRRGFPTAAIAMAYSASQRKPTPLKGAERASADPAFTQNPTMRFPSKLLSFLRLT